MSAGDLDLTFHSAGTQQVAVGHYATSVALQNGKTLLVGTDHNGGVTVVRLNPNGTQDMSYGSGGEFTYPAEFTDIGSSNDPGPNAVLQSNGELVITTVQPNVGLTSAFQVIRVDTTGKLDTNFGDHGVVTLPFVESYYSNTTDSDTQNGPSIAIRGNNFMVVTATEHVVQLTPNGAIDTNFGGNGGVVKLPDNFSATATAIQSDGQVVIVGNDSGVRAALVRLTASGSIETGLGTGGVVDLNFSDQANAVTFQSNGQIIVAGSQYQGPGFVSRLNTDTTPDTSFGSGGTVTLNQYAVIKAVGVEWDGKILTSGSSHEATALSNEVVTRLTTTGALDSGFASNGIKTISFGLGSSAYSQVLLIANNQHKLLVSGGTHGTYTAALLLLDSSDNSGGGSSSSGSGSGGGITIPQYLVNELTIPTLGDLVQGVHTPRNPNFPANYNFTLPTSFLRNTKPFYFRPMLNSSPTPRPRPRPASTPAPVVAPFRVVIHHPKAHHQKVRHHVVIN